MPESCSKRGASVFKNKIGHSIGLQFLSVISAILLLGAIVLSTVIALNERKALRHSLTSKGQALASYIAKLSLDPFIMKDNIQLDVIVSEANKDPDILCAVVRDVSGNILSSQFASINIRSVRLKPILMEIGKDADLQKIVAEIEAREPVTIVSAPITTGNDRIGTVSICLSNRTIREQLMKTVLYVLFLSALLAFALGYVLYAVSNQIILTPVIELANAAGRLAKGDLSTHVSVTTSGEIRQLVNSFNQMAVDLQKTTVSKNYFDNIIKSMTDTLAVASPSGIIQKVNQAMCTLLGYQEEELIGQPLTKIFAKETKGGKAFDEALTYRLVKNAECTYATKEGKQIPVLLSSSAIYSDNASPQGIVCVAVDITERKRTEEKLQRYATEIQQANEELKTFTYTVSHDLRAPLVNIRGFSEEFKRTIQEGREFLAKYVPTLSEGDKKTYSLIFEHDIDEAVGFITASVRRMDSLIESILKLSRLGRSELRPEPVDTEQLVESLLKTLAHQIESRQGEVRVGLLPVLMVDRTAIERIFGNLLDNAVKYLDASRPGRIEVSAEQSDAEIIFTVRDNGRGIAKEDIQKIFEPFRRVGNPDVPGEGMGLTYVKALVKRLGGRIWCESELEIGTAFKFTIPVKAGS